MKRIFALLLVSLSIMTVLPVSGNAGGYEGYPFAVVIIPPDNSIDDLGYYHVPGKPGEKITLKAKLTNIIDKPIEIKAVQLDAYSGLQGIFYQKPDEVDSNLYSHVNGKHDVAQYINVTGLITLKPKQSQEIEINVTVPDINKGTLLGGIQFVVFAGTQEAQIDKQNSSILIDKYQAITIAIQIDLTEKDQTSIKIGEPEFIESSQSLGVWISNEAAIIEKNISGTYQIKDKNNVISEGSIKAFKMAPMTRFKYLIPWGDRPFEQGAYTLYVQIDADGRPFNFEIPLGTEQKPVPTKGENTEGNTDNTHNPQTDSNSAGRQGTFKTFFFIGLAGIIFIFALLIYLSYRKSRRMKH